MTNKKSFRRLSKCIQYFHFESHLKRTRKNTTAFEILELHRYYASKFKQIFLDFNQIKIPSKSGKDKIFRQKRQSLCELTSIKSTVMTLDRLCALHFEESQIIPRSQNAQPRLKLKALPLLVHRPKVKLKSESVQEMIRNQ